MASESITLTKKEADRLGILQAVAEGSMSRREAAARLGLGERQVRRLAERLAREGPRGLVSRSRGRRSGNAIPAATREAIMDRVRERYADFPPTLAREKLAERDGLRVSKETLRKWMAEDGLWRAKGRKKPAVHRTRQRRARVGELVQIDGSPHDWFEGRDGKCSLIAFVDDATSLLLAARFRPTETTEAYMRTLRAYIDMWGCPAALYSDRHSIFRINVPGKEGERTQFSRALDELGIEAVHAYSPQAKGRVERVFRTLQERLTRELRLEGVSGIEAANGFLEGYVVGHNARFAQEPREEGNGHREHGFESVELDRILCLRHERKLTRNLTFKFANREYGIQGEGKGYRLQGKEVTLREGWDGELTVLLGERELQARVLGEGRKAVPLEDSKTVNSAADRAAEKQRKGPKYKPAANHPWKVMARQAKELAEARRAAGKER